ncbi:hypothetical protein BDB00DRAFT_793505 [Zychaea mexicana]|uniref:uncharacterized protein n=1 Tax=Zychaea mexicana TaxID=64656 RepID=UPI0022FEDCA1|nr:uncharacterized protein BDB00DRAFT_793505 [Zychaea mexicana]KAI9472930.1 hypothetical protein BDB00DRAFT_793505 [Zychaea mexicana]
MIMDLFDNTTTTAASTTSNNNNNNSSDINSNTNSTRPKEIDHIDAVLLQRLEQFIHNPETRQDFADNVASTEKTSHADDSKGLGGEELYLLPTTAAASSSSSSSSKRRHCQTQTTQTCITQDNTIRQQHHRSSSNGSSIAPGTTVEHLERQIAEEKRRQKRLEAAMVESSDQFQVLSGLAYMKLRELWEERVRWEEAYFALSERLDEVRQQHGGGSSDHHGGEPVVVNSTTASQPIMESVP